MGRMLGARLAHAELAIDAGARLRARLRDDSRADAPARAQSLEAILAARRRRLSAPSRGAPVVIDRRTSVVQGDTMKRITTCVIALVLVSAIDARAQVGAGSFTG